MKIPNGKTFNHICDTLLGKRWIFAKTMPKSPHWYTLRREWQDDGLFNEMVNLIREYGYKEKYGHSWYTRIDVNDMKYWTMGAPVAKTILINRAAINLHSPYDDIADRYDGLFCDERSKRENAEMFALLPRDVGHLLDIGCGTGLLLDYLSPDRYTGIDPSQKMLDRLKVKHPQYADGLIKSRFESFHGGVYDTVVALFGSASYVNPSVLSRVEMMLNPGGRYFLMFYKSDYSPLTYVKTGVELSHFTGGERELSGAVLEYCNFLIATGTR